MPNANRIWNVSTATLLGVLGFATLAACGDAGGTTSTPPSQGDGSNNGNAAPFGGSGESGSQSASSKGTTPATGNALTPSTPSAAPVTDIFTFAGLPTGADQLKVLCARGGKNALTAAVCNGGSISGLLDLQAALGLQFKDTTAMGFNGVNGNPAFALLAQSTSVVVRDVSAANPRAIIMTPPSSWQINKSIALDSSTNQAPPANWNPPSTPDQTSWVQPSTYTPPTQSQTLATWPPVVTIPGQCTAWGGCGPNTTSSGFNGQGTGSANSSFSVIAYTRGEPFAEVAANDPQTGTLRFFLVKFTPKCIGSSCSSQQLFGPNVESDWSNVSIYEDVDLANTVIDCTHCHSTSSGQKTLRMQEMQNPWTHWMSEWTAGGEALLSDFHAVHGNAESYGGIPAALIDKSEPRTLELLLTDNGYTANANAFPSRSIETEVKQSSPTQPLSNQTPGDSGTWQKLFLTAHTSGGLAAPFHDVKVADEGKLSLAAAQYQSFTSTGDLSWLPSMTNMFSDSSLVDIGIQPPATATGPEILAQACTGCHNTAPNASLSRSGFNATALSTMTRAEKDLAIARVQMPAEDVRHMPPTQLTTLTADQSAALIDLLSE